ncbi:MAG: L-threonylcarbamoyladenylate synthase, partial [Elusimicrobiales bacterium]|nr:L-threonylcarbamoyladenylate synthase [Elusimicrobiales bacterium]
MPIIKATKSNIEKCAKLIKKGELVAFPTETVYGLGGCVFNEKAIKKIFKLKQRPYNDPLIVHISSYKQLKEIAYVDKKILSFLKKIWPSPLTIILPKKNVIPDIVTSKLNTVAVRYPQNKIALSLIKLSKTPIAAPSANKFSRLSPTTPQHVFKYFPTIPILDGGKTVHGIESTVIKIENDILYILRYGAVTVEKLKKIWKGKIKKYNNKNKKLSPGMLKKHYSPIKK